MKMKGQVALITGAGKGIGRSMVDLFVREGAKVIAVTRREYDWVAYPDQVHPYVCDCSDENSVEQMAQSVKSRFPDVSILINNAAIGKFGNITDFSVVDWDEVHKNGVRSMFLVTKFIAPLMIEGGRGSIINIASVAGTKPMPGQSAYSSSKFAVIGFTKAIDEELRPHGIRVSYLAPGGTDTTFGGWDPDNPNQPKMLTPESVAEAALFLATIHPNVRINSVVMRSMNEAL